MAAVGRMKKKNERKTLEKTKIQLEKYNVRSVDGLALLLPTAA